MIYVEAIAYLLDGLLLTLPLKKLLVLHINEGFQINRQRINK